MTRRNNIYNGAKFLKEFIRTSFSIIVLFLIAFLIYKQVFTETEAHLEFGKEIKSCWSFAFRSVLFPEVQYH